MSPVTAGNVAAQIQDLRRVRREAAIWRYGALLIVVLTVAWTIISLRNSTKALLTPGPAQDQFASSLSTGLQQDVVPSLQSMAGQTLTEMKPQVMEAFQHVQARAPEVADASARELTTLQSDIASRSEQALDATFTQELKSRESRIREMFPNATDAQMQTFVDNMTAMGAQHITSANDRLLAKHMTAMSSIVTDMTRIQDAEKAHIQGDTAPWEFTMGVFDILHDDLKTLAPTSTTTLASAPGPKTAIATASSAEKEGN